MNLDNLFVLLFAISAAMVLAFLVMMVVGTVLHVLTWLESRSYRR
jgi:hypothetical protein